MARKREIPARPVMPDAKYNSKLVTMFVHKIMRDGKKSTAESVLYKAFDVIQQKAGKQPLEVFESALNNVKPKIEVKSRRVGGSTYQVPTEIREPRRIALAIRWLLTFSAVRAEKGMHAKLAGELMDAASERGASVKKKEDTHKMAEANKAFAHYRW
ncbi:MAG: 30S ribosomal protein S7 [Thermodesulfobacteriota bacterium]